MNIFVILVSLLWLGILAASFISLVVLLLFAWAKGSWKFAWWSVFGTVSAAALLSGLLLFGYSLLFAPYEPTTDAELAQAYETEFNNPPPPGIKVLHARQYIIGDSGGQWLLLEATPEEIERHIAMGFEASANVLPDFRGEAGGSAPSWWQPPSGQLDLYEHLDWSKNGGWYSSRAAIGVDRRKNRIWFIADKHD